MLIIKDLNQVPVFRNPVVTIGTFDGVHLGHRKLIQMVNEMSGKMNGEGVAITFWPHPRRVLDEVKDEVSLLNTFEDKIRIFEELKLDNLIILDFTKEFSKQKPEIFLTDILVKKLHAKALVIGFNHRFGVNRSGNFEFLKNNADLYGFEVIEVPAFEMNGETISSTKIRGALLQGDVERANLWLGYPYRLEGKVVRGMGLGKKIGFPTANIDIGNIEKLVPKDGVYVVKAGVEGRSYYGMLNIGNNPTFPERPRTIEVNIFDFDEDIYNSFISVDLVARVRDEKKFSGVEELIQWIRLDKEKSLQIITNLTN